MPSLISLVIPIFNEEQTIPHLAERLLQLMAGLNHSTEVVFVDDGSRDQSFSMLKALNQRDARFKVVRFSRNFGHQIAITAGLQYARGDAAIILDADLQDPPEVIPEMLDRWSKGSNIVVGVRRSRQGESAFKKITASVYYRVLKYLCELDLPLEAGDFRLVDRKAINAFLRLSERGRYVRGMFAWIGFKHDYVYYDRAARFAGETKYPLAKMIRFATDGVISFSDRPLRIVLRIGLAIAAVSFICGVWALWVRVFGSGFVKGWASLLILISFVLGVQLTVLGIIGEYIARITDEVRNRPLFLTDECIGINEKSAPVHESHVA